jgi:hypothetical protein
MGRTATDVLLAVSPPGHVAVQTIDRPEERNAGGRRGGRRGPLLSGDDHRR